VPLKEYALGLASPGHLGGLSLDSYRSDARIRVSCHTLFLHVQTRQDAGIQRLTIDLLDFETLCVDGQSQRLLSA
jgi:hypothetical protein